MKTRREPFENDVKIEITRKWSQVGLATRIYYLESCRANLRRLASLWVEQESSLRGHSGLSVEGAESWLLGPLPVARTLRYLVRGLRSAGRPIVPSCRLRIDGRSVSRVFPCGFFERVLYWDVEAHVWSTGSQLQGCVYRGAGETDLGPALILGASNVSSILATDLLSKLFAENRPVVCVLPPRLAPLLPIFRDVFHPLIRNRHAQILCGGPELAESLLDRPEFDRVHLTGMRKTFEIICRRNQYMNRSFSAELGCVTPVIIVPGTWSREEVLYQARHLVSLLVLNGGYNCTTPQVVIFSRNWSRKDVFLEAVRAELKSLVMRYDRFPGAAQRRESFLNDYPQGERFGPRTLVKLDPHRETRLFSEEALCGVVGWVELDAEEPEKFMHQASRFCNKRLWGDLSCLILIDEDTRLTYERVLSRTIGSLEYGSVGLNVYAGLAFMSGVTPWGSYFEGKMDNSMAWVHNAYFFDRPEKTIVEGSFMPPNAQPWVKPFPDLYKVAQALFEFELDPSFTTFVKFLVARGCSAIPRKVRAQLGSQG